ncbi:MAG TPA: molecular chaperone DnaJ [Longimicrobiales bacterium]|nr:molecular chaperone DnaJ [Longimicrobiales bacterium]
MRDYYEILGVERGADADAIKRSYRKLALQYHPDRNNGSAEAEEQFKELTEAYEVLKDPNKRAAYDRFGHAGVKGGAGAGYGGFSFHDALDIFMRDFGGFGVEDIFGGGGGRQRRGGQSVRKGPDMRITFPLTLDEVAEGVKRTVRIDVNDECSRCAGTGAKEGTSPVTCSTCGGAGEVRRVQRSFLGQLVSVMPCPECGGEGQRIEQPCEQCSGRGVERAQRELEVNVPPGVSTGDYLTLRAQGNAGVRGGPRGDVLVVLDVEEDERFLRDGADLIYELPITFSQAALGAELEVPTIGGTAARLRVAPGTQSGRLLRMRGRGLPQLQSTNRGDLIIRVVVWTPTTLTPEQEEAFRRLAKVEAPAERVDDDRDRGFWSRVKEALTGS